jgi:predicted dehydrogenase
MVRWVLDAGYWMLVYGLEEQIMAKKLKAGVIGTGIIGKSHIRGYANMADDVEIVAVADLDKAEADRVAKEHNIPNVFTDYKALLKIDEIDCVDVCLPNFLHSPVTVAALKAGKNVYCEKPMARNAEEAQKMFDAAKKKGKMLAVQLSSLFSPQARAAKQIVDDGVLGRVYYVKTSHYRRRGRVYVDGYATPHFVQKDKSGGGALADMAVYHMALMVWLLGNPALKTVSASTYQEIPMDEERREESKYDVEELGIGFVRFEGDITMFVEESWAINMDRDEGDCIMGVKGGLRLNPLTLLTEVAGIQVDQPLDLESFKRRRQSIGKNEAGYEGSQKNFVWAQLGRVPLLDSASIALKVAQITDAMYRSAELGREVSL